MTRRIPLPAAARRGFGALRAFGLVMALAGLILGFALWNLDHRSNALFVGSLGVAFALLTWISPWSRLWVPVFAAVGALLAVSMRSWIVAVGVAVWTGWLWWRIRRPVSPGVEPQSIAITDPAAVMKGAEEFVAAFTDAGFHQVGALEVPIRGFTVIASLLIAPDRASYAEVTDSVVSLTSVFPARRTLTTRNSGMASVPETILTNDVRAGSPVELIDAHRRALGLLNDRGETPEPLEPATLSSLVLELERESVAWANRNPRRPRSVGGSGPLGESMDLEERIERWRLSADPRKE
jgi:hypothetical protein